MNFSAWYLHVLELFYYVHARIEGLRVHAGAKLLVLVSGENLLVSLAKQAFKSILFPQQLCLQPSQHSMNKSHVPKASEVSESCAFST
jgi:hypothetical protein